MGVNAPLPAQPASPAAACVRGTVMFDANDAPTVRATARRATWPSPELADALVQSGVLAGYDGLVKEAKMLLDSAQVNAAADGARQRRWLDSVLAVGRTQLQSVVESGGKTIRPNDASLTVDGDLKPEIGPRPGTALVGDDVVLDFDSAHRVASSALCLVASSVSRYVTTLRNPALDAVAKQYAGIQARWTTFSTNAFSLTFVERLALSCRLGILNRVVSITTRCGSRAQDRWTLAALEPPRWRTVFAHPSAAVQPLLKRDSAFRAAGQVEWYGVLRHQYVGAGIRTWGATVATLHFDGGTSHLGGVLHTPLAKVGAFSGRAGRTLFTLEADLMGWVPGTRAAIQRVRSDRLSSAFRTIAP
jgi:hypothetical protein